MRINFYCSLSELSIFAFTHSREINVLLILKWQKHLCGRA